MSSLALTSVASSAAPTARSKDPLQQLLPGPLSSYREFPQGDELAHLHRGLRQQRQAAPQGGHRRVAEGRRRAVGVRHPRRARQQRAEGVVGRLRLHRADSAQDVAAGLYVLRVEAKSRLGDQPDAARETIIRVVAPGPQK